MLHGVGRSAGVPMSERQHRTRKDEREPEPSASRFLCFFAAPFGVRFLRVECFRGGRPLAPLYMPMTVGRYVRGFKLAAKTNVLAACKTLGIPPSKLDDGQNRCPPAPAAVRTPRFHCIAAPEQRCDS